MKRTDMQSRTNILEVKLRELNNLFTKHRGNKKRKGLMNLIKEIVRKEKKLKKMLKEN